MTAPRLGFVIDLIKPADSPSQARLSGYGLSIHLTTHVPEFPTRLLLPYEAATIHGTTSSRGQKQLELTAPNNTLISFEDPPGPILIPDVIESLIIKPYPTASEDDCWGHGRAGMKYRDLIPGRLGGCFIASHIKIADGGPVPDYVHYHRIRFQMIYCLTGWVKVVYEDQGEPFVMRRGDCVLQPPEIRHRVLESSDGLEVRYQPYPYPI